jgi:hypothetical protein
MGDARLLDHAHLLKINLLRANILEQSDPFAKPYGHEVEMYFVQQSSF